MLLELTEKINASIFQIPLGKISFNIANVFRK